MNFSSVAGRFAVAASLAALTIPLAADGPSDPQIAVLERAVAASPEDLRTCADYRQRIIASGQYDRAIKMLERLAARPGAGPNVHISLALAYVDEVPAASPFRRIFLGRDATRSASKAIEREPSPVAYYIRGLIALFYPEAVFHRARGGIADLEHVRGMLVGLAAQPAHALVYQSLGDGYWKVHDLARAVATWKEGLDRFPSNAGLRVRLTNRGPDLDRIVEHALDPATRVDTSLQDLFGPAGAP